MTKAEQETLIRWDEEEQVAWLETSYPPTAGLWKRRGYPVTVAGLGDDGKPQRWRAKVPVVAISFRSMVDGKIKQRTGHSKGRLFQSAQRDV